MIQVIKDKKVPDFCHKTQYSAGYDLYACLDQPVILKPMETYLVPTGIKVNMMNDCPGCMGLVFPRSGVSLKTNLRVCNSVGLVDQDYQGEIKVIMQNIGNDDVTINPLDRIAQLVFAYHSSSTIDFVEVFNQSTERGAGGFGSTGK